MKQQIENPAKPGARPGNQNAAKKPADRRDTRIVVRCTEAEKQQSQDMAKKAGMSLSVWARHRMMGGSE